MQMVDIGLPLVLTKEGIKFDDSFVGKVYPSVYLLAQFGELLCDGSRYDSTQKSSDGIPYSRLLNKIYDNNNRFPRFGTGDNYFICVLSNVPSAGRINICSNNAGSITAPDAGTSGFTIDALSDGVSFVDAYAALSGTAGSSTVTIYNSNVGLVTNWHMGTSPFTLNIITNNTNTFAVNEVTFTAESTFSAGIYFSFYTYYGGSNQYYCWYQIDGSGTDPAPGGTGIRIDVKTGDTAYVVAQKTAMAMQGRAVTYAVIPDASSITAGTYFTVYASNEGVGSTPYHIWYKKDGSGTDPSPTDSIGIQVNVASGDSSNDCAIKTQEAINKRFFAVPDLQGRFIRGYDGGGANDPGALNRFNNYVPFEGGALIGSMQLDTFQSHNHVTSGPTDVQGGAGATDVMRTTNFNGFTQLSGSSENRPKNTSLNYVIKY